MGYDIAYNPLDCVVSSFSHLKYLKMAIMEDVPHFQTHTYIDKL